MARRKNQPEAVRVKCHLAERLRELRIELFGERGGSEMARRLGVPIRTWYNYESGVTVPAEVLLRFMELTAVEPTWLLHGMGSKFRTNLPSSASPDPKVTVEALLRTALQHLERDLVTSVTPNTTSHGPDGVLDGAVLPTAWRQWSGHATESTTTAVEVLDDAMVPILTRGAQVAYSQEEEAVENLEGALVVAWVQEKPMVRWFRRSGSFGLLRAENPDYSPNIHLIDLTAPTQERTLRRVLWTSSPR